MSIFLKSKLNLIFLLVLASQANTVYCQKTIQEGTVVRVRLSIRIFFADIYAELNIQKIVCQIRFFAYQSNHHKCH